MTVRRTILATTVATALALACIGPAVAEGGGLKPIQGQSIDLGGVSGVAYYTVERGGFRVVATLVQPGVQGSETPVRLEAVLAPGQSVILSTPRGVGVAADAVEISRQGNAVFVRAPAAPVTN